MHTDSNAPTSSLEWQYQIMGSTFGPIKQDEMRRLIDRGEISRDTFVKPTSAENWITADRFGELSSESVSQD